MRRSALRMSVAASSVDRMQTLFSSGCRSEPAYQVPWRVDRRDRAFPVVRNAGDDGADFVRIFSTDAGGESRTELFGEVSPGDRIGLALPPGFLDEIVMTIAWFRREDGLEYVWRFVV